MSAPPSVPSPGIATGEPWTHPPNYQQYPPPRAYPIASSVLQGDSAAANGDETALRHNMPGFPMPAATCKAKSGKVSQTMADAVAASVGNNKERKRKVSSRRVSTVCIAFVLRTLNSHLKYLPSQRIHYSCAECHRRKHKCDRQYPCGPCIDRGIGESCRVRSGGPQRKRVRRYSCSLTAGSHACRR